VKESSFFLRSEMRQASGTSSERINCIIKIVTSTRLKRRREESSGVLHWQVENVSKKTLVKTDLMLRGLTSGKAEFCLL